MTRSAFTVYGITVRKGASQWQVFRRYREWEDLRMRLLQELGSAPPMPPKQLFGRMRPEVIEHRVLGLNLFLQLCLGTPMYALHPVLQDFLERQKNVPPEVRCPQALPSRPAAQAPLPACAGLLACSTCAAAASWQGLDPALLDTPLDGGAGGMPDGSPQGLRQQQLKDLVESASQASSDILADSHLQLATCS